MQPRPLPKFSVAAVENPAGFKPGLYFYVLFLEQNRKVSRYLRRADTAFYKIQQYETRYNAGDRAWPEVTRADELRDSKYAVPSRVERFVRAAARAFSLPPYPAPAGRFGPCACSACTLDVWR